MSTDLTTALAATDTAPSEAQIAAGNYRKGKVRLHGLLISIENPKGTRRRPEWPPLAAHYGYVNRTEGRDGDAVDVYLGPNLASELVFVIDQTTASGKRFDEHKCVLGCVSKQQAKKLYLACYQSGWKCGPITAMTIEQFKEWLAKGDTTARVAEQVSRYDKTAGIAAPAAPAAPAMPSAGSPGDASQHQVGETKTGASGETLRLNEHHRWELANPNDPAAGQPGMGDAAGQPGQPGEAAAPPPPPSPANDHAARHAFVTSKLSAVHPELGGLIRAIHESPHYKSSGEYVSFDVHQKVAGDLHHSLGLRAGQEFGGGQVVDLGEGRMGFASEAGSLVVWPADASGKHKVSYTHKTGIVGRAMAKGGGENGSGQDAQQEQPAEGEPDEQSTGGQSGMGEPPQPAGGAEPPQQAQGEQPAPAPEPEPVPPPRPGVPRGKPLVGESPFRQPGEGLAKPQSPPPGRKHPDEEIYDAELVPPKPRGEHVALRETANQWKAKAIAARDAWTQAVEDRENPKRINALKKKFSALREAYNDHERHAKRAEAEHKSRLKESGKATKERMKAMGIGPYAGKGGKGKPAADPNQPKGTMPDKSAGLRRNFTAGNNRGSIEFESEQHRDLYDLGAKHSYVGRGGRNKTSNRHVGDIKALTAKLTESTGMSESELRGHAAEVFKHTKAQMKGIGDGEHRATKMPTAKDTAPLVDAAEQNEGKGDVPTPSAESLEMSKLPKESQHAANSTQTHLKAAGLSVTPENHKAIQHAISKGWVKNKSELRSLLKRAKQIHDQGAVGKHNYHELKGIKDPKAKAARAQELAASDHHAIREAIRRKANRERRASWQTILKQQGEAWGMTPQEYHELAKDMYPDFIRSHQGREDAKRRIREATGMSRKGVEKLENSGGKDSDALSGKDKLLQQIAGEHPEFFEGKDHAEVAWELLKEGPKRVPSKLSDEFLTHVDEWLGHQQKAAGGGSPTGRGDAWEGPEGDDAGDADFQPGDGDSGELAMAGGGDGNRDDDAIPFAKVRRGMVWRYRRWKAGLL